MLNQGIVLAFGKQDLAAPRRLEEGRRRWRPTVPKGRRPSARSKASRRIGHHHWHRRLPDSYRGADARFILLVILLMHRRARRSGASMDGVIEARAARSQRPAQSAGREAGARSGVRHLRGAAHRALADRRRHDALLLLGECRAAEYCERRRSPYAPAGLEEQIRADIVEAGRRLYARALRGVQRRQHQRAARRARLITTPKSVSKGFMTPDMMVIVDYEGKKVAGERDASSELPMHLEIYRNRPDVNAVVHAHPPLATGFAVAGIPLTRAVLAEVITTLGSIPIAAYGTPSTAELPEAVRKYIKAHDGMLLANHGAVTCGPDVMARVLQDGDDRALREDQPGGAACSAASI